MSFLPPTINTQEVPPSGDPSSPIAIIGEAPSWNELKAGRPFVGPSGGVLEQCLHSAQLTRAEIYITNLIKIKVDSIGKFFNKKKGLTEEGLAWAELLKEELQSIGANILVPLGGPALCALTGHLGILKYRGYMMESTLLPGRKVLPTIHPAAALRGNYLYRHYISHDLYKAKNLSTFPDIIYQPMETIIPKGFEETTHILRELQKAPIISIDIEVANEEVSCIGFSTNIEFGYSIPFMKGTWTVMEEVLLWELIADILEGDAIKVGQNFMFDIMFLAEKNGIITKCWHPEKGPLIFDTMIMHSLIYPDFRKSLAFLASIYLNIPYWKDMVHWKGKDLTKEDN